MRAKVLADSSRGTLAQSGCGAARWLRFQQCHLMVRHDMGKPKPLYIAKHMLKHGSCLCSARCPLMRIVGRSEKSNGAYRHDTRAIREPPVTNRPKQRTNKKFVKGPIDMKTAVNGHLADVAHFAAPTQDNYIIIWLMDSVRSKYTCEVLFCSL